MDGSRSAATLAEAAALAGPGTVRTTCAYCGVGCGVLATPDGHGGLAIAGDPTLPANLGRLCSKGSALGETVGLEGRLLHPLIGGERASWDTALDLVATRFSDTIARHGPDRVAFYVSGQMLTEDYYVANKLMKGFIGSANIDTNSRLCMASTVAGHRRAFGTDTVPGLYEGLEEADLVMLVGSNLAWCHPVLYERLAAAKAARSGMKVVNIDPRRTATSDLADLHLAIAPGSDVALFNRAGQFGLDFDISGLSDLSDAEYDLMEPMRWPVSATRRGGRFFGDGRFFTGDGRARMVAVRHRPPAAEVTPEHPFRLNTGCIRDQWHTMTRTAKSPRLSQHLAEPFLEIHPDDASCLGIRPAHLVRVESALGKVLLRALLTTRVRRCEVFAPIHWTSETAPAARIATLIAPEVDPVSGQPESKASAVAVRPFAAAWYGFAVSAATLRPATD